MIPTLTRKLTSLTMAVGSNNHGRENAAWPNLVAGILAKDLQSIAEGRLEVSSAGSSG